VIALCVGAGVASGVGVGDYAMHVAIHDFSWREFATSTPDYFAGFLVITIPVTLVMFAALSEETNPGIRKLVGISLVLQAAVLPTTGSRFALISLLIGLAATATAAFAASKHERIMTPPIQRRLMFLGIAAIVVAALFMGPILHRLSKSTMQDQAHSWQFRVYTWRGAARSAFAAPILGFGPGMFVYTYPRRALVGFTRVAHEGYLQEADDIGIPATVFMVFAMVALIGSGLRSLTGNPQNDYESEAPESAPDSPPSRKSRRRDAIAAVPAKTPTSSVNRQWLLSGLIGACVAGMLQNTIDSDLFVFFDAIALWYCLAVIGAISIDKRQSELAIPKFVPVTAMSVAAILLLSHGLGLFLATLDKLDIASEIDPLTAKYPLNMGWENYSQGDLESAVDNLKRASTLTPDSVSFHRMGMVYESMNRSDMALAAFQKGLSYEPTSLELLLSIAQLYDETGNHQMAVPYYARMASLQAGPYGTVLAITEVVEYRYAYADYALALDAYEKHDSAGAERLATKAQSILEEYVDEGGSSNAMRIAQTGGRPDTQLDVNLSALYDKDTDLLVTVDMESKHVNLAQLELTITKYKSGFDSITKHKPSS
jgi:tetratricopeptide (TPR) repeat protein